MCILSLLCCSQFTIWNTTLPEPLTQFGVSTYNDELTVINGYMRLSSLNYPYNNLSYSISLTSTGTDWSNNTVSMFGSHYISYWGDGSVEVNDKVYVISPRISIGTGSTVTSGRSMLIYDLTLKQYVDTSTYASSPPLKTFYPCAVYNYKNNLIYVMGGYFYTHKAYTQTYDITNDLWGSVSNINVARNDAGCDMDVSAEHIYLFGGDTSAEQYGSSGIEEYTVSTDTWTVLSTTLIDPSREFDCTLLPSDGKIYCVGGRYRGTYMDSVQQFDPTDYSINKLTMNIPRREGKAITWGNDCLLIVGGMTESFKNTDTIEYYGNCKFSSFKLEDITLTTPSNIPTQNPTNYPSTNPSDIPSKSPTYLPSFSPTETPTNNPISAPTTSPTKYPTKNPSITPTQNPTVTPTKSPTFIPSKYPSISPTKYPTSSPTNNPSITPTKTPSKAPTNQPTHFPTMNNEIVCPTSVSGDYNNHALIFQVQMQWDGELIFDASASNFIISKITCNKDKTFISETTTSKILALNDNTKIGDYTFIIEGETGTMSKQFMIEITCPTDNPTTSPSSNPSIAPTNSPSKSPTNNPSITPTKTPTTYPSKFPTETPTKYPSITPTQNPTITPTKSPTNNPSITPTKIPPTKYPTQYPSISPSNNPSEYPTQLPTKYPTINPSITPTKTPTIYPSKFPTKTPTNNPSKTPTKFPTKSPTNNPSITPTQNPTVTPTKSPTNNPSIPPTNNPSITPTKTPSKSPTKYPTQYPSISPSNNPSEYPTKYPTNNPSITPTKTPSLSPTSLPSETPSMSPTELVMTCNSIIDWNFRWKRIQSWNENTMGETYKLAAEEEFINEYPQCGEYNTDTLEYYYYFKNKKNKKILKIFMHVCCGENTTFGCCYNLPNNYNAQYSPNQAIINVKSHKGGNYTHSDSTQTTQKSSSTFHIKEYTMFGVLGLIIICCTCGMIRITQYYNKRKKGLSSTVNREQTELANVIQMHDLHYPLPRPQHVQLPSVTNINQATDGSTITNTGFTSFKTHTDSADLPMQQPPIKLITNNVMRVKSFPSQLVIAKPNENITDLV